MPSEVLCLGRASDPCFTELAARFPEWPRVSVAHGAPPPRVVPDSQILIADPGLLTNESLKATATECVLFTSCWYEHLDLAALEARGISVAGVGEAVGPAVAAHIQGQLNAAFGEGGLRGKTCGVVGLGRAGIALAKLLGVAGARVVYQDVRTAPHGLAAELAIRRLTRDRLLVESDVVVVLVPLTPQTAASFDDREFALMQSSSVFVHFSPPAVVNAASVGDAISHKQIGRVILGRRDQALEGMGGVTFAPFAPEDSGEVVRAMAYLIQDNVRRFRESAPLRSIVESITYPRAGDPAFWSSRMAPRLVGGGPSS